MNDELRNAEYIAARRENETQAVLQSIRVFVDKPIGGILYTDNLNTIRGLVGVLSACHHHEIDARRTYEDLKKNEEFRRRQQAAHAAVAAAIKSGNLVRPTVCERCPYEGPDVIAHHDDYDKPLDVEWLCRSCHGQHHAEHGPAL